MAELPQCDVCGAEGLGLVQLKRLAGHVIARSVEDVRTSKTFALFCTSTRQGEGTGCFGRAKEATIAIRGSKPIPLELKSWIPLPLQRIRQVKKAYGKRGFKIWDRTWENGFWLDMQASRLTYEEQREESSSSNSGTKKSSAKKGKGHAHGSESGSEESKSVSSDSDSLMDFTSDSSSSNDCKIKKRGAKKTKIVRPKATVAKKSGKIEVVELDSDSSPSSASRKSKKDKNEKEAEFIDIISESHIKESSAGSESGEMEEENESEPAKASHELNDNAKRTKNLSSDVSNTIIMPPPNRPSDVRKLLDELEAAYLQWDSTRRPPSGPQAIEVKEFPPYLKAKFARIAKASIVNTRQLRLIEDWLWLHLRISRSTCSHLFAALLLPEPTPIKRKYVQITPSKTSSAENVNSSTHSLKLEVIDQDKSSEIIAGANAAAMRSMSGRLTDEDLPERKTTKRPNDTPERLDQPAKSPKSTTAKVTATITANATANVTATVTSATTKISETDTSETASEEDESISEEPESTTIDDTETNTTKETETMNTEETEETDTIGEETTAIAEDSDEPTSPESPSNTAPARKGRRQAPPKPQNLPIYDDSNRAKFLALLRDARSPYSSSSPQVPKKTAQNTNTAARIPPARATPNPPPAIIAPPVNSPTPIRFNASTLANLSSTTSNPLSHPTLPPSAIIAPPVASPTPIRFNASTLANLSPTASDPLFDPTLSLELMGRSLGHM